MMTNSESQNQLDITRDIKEKWQDIINVIAKILNVPAGLIMRKVDSDITVFLSSDTENNPYIPGAKEHLEDSGLYCETVIKTNSMLLVPNALSDELWENNPDVKLNMISYLGFPITLPDKTPFGTICVLDNKENKYSELYKDLIASFRDTIVRDIELLYSNHSLEENNAKLNTLLLEKETILRETHHRIKNIIASIEGMLSLQSQSISNPEAVSALEDALSRVSSMRILYEKLLITKDYEDISVKEYLESLIDAVVELFPYNLKITVAQKIAALNLPSKKLFPLGIILNELLTNIMKYAFKGRESGLVNIALSNRQNRVTLTVQDNGNGLPEGFDISESKGFGLMLVKILSEQLGGIFTIENYKGAKSTLKFEI
jgi:two-component sensor histidine kinase